MIQELLVEPNAIVTEYTYEQCSMSFIFDGIRVCIDYGTVTQETSAFIPRFTYNYQVIVM